MGQVIQVSRREHRDLRDWGDLVSKSLINLDFLPQRSGFAGNLDIASSSDGAAGRLSGTPHRTTRSLRKLREAENDFVLLIYVKHGSAGLTHQAFDGVLTAGSFFVLDGHKPHELTMDAYFEHVVLRLPKFRFTSLHPAASCLLRDPIETSGDEVTAAAKVLELIPTLENCPITAFSTLSETVVRLLGDLFLRDDQGLPTGPSRHRLLQYRLQKYLNENFSDPTLTAAALAEKMGISRRYFDTLCAEMSTTFGRALIEKRLERSWKLLTDSRAKARSVTDIAYDSGFNDLSHFSKRFKERYGVAPRQARVRTAP